MKRFIPYLALVAVVAMAGCSGDSPSAKPVPTVVPVSWDVSSLTVSDSDVPLGTPIQVDVEVTKDGSPAPDGTVVQMSSGGPPGAEAFGYVSGSSSKNAAQLHQTASIVTEDGRATTYFIADYVDPSSSEHADDPVGTYVIQAKATNATRQVSVEYRASSASGTLQLFSVDPSRGSYAGGQQVVILGKGIVAPVEVTFILNGVPFSAEVINVLESIPSSGPGSIVAITPRFTGTDTSIEQQADIRVVARVGSIGGEEKDTLFQAFSLLPGLGTVIYGVAPNSGRSSGGEVINILGQGFGSNAAEVSATFTDSGGSVRIGRVLAVAPDGTQIQVETPRFSTLPLATDHPQDVSVTTPEGSARIEDGFLVLADDPQPTINSISPTSGPLDGDTLVTIFGNGFQAPMQVFFGNLTALDVNVFNDTTPADNDRITCVTPDYSQQEEVPPVTVDVVVTNMTSGKTNTLGGAFTYGDPLWISGNSPTEGGLGDLVIIYGSGFEDPLQVFLGDAPMEVVSVSGTELVVRIPDDLATECSGASGSFKVVLLESNQEATGGNFTIRGNMPTVLSVSPIIFQEDELGTPEADIIITGLAFADEVLVQVGTYTMPSSQVTVNSDTSIDADDLPEAGVLGIVFATTPCTTGGGLPGAQSSATALSVGVTNFPGACTDTLAGAIVVEPTASTCTALSMSVSPTNLDFGTTAGDLTFTISNDGPGPFGWTGTLSDPENVFSLTPTSGNLQQGEAILVTVTFTDAAAPDTHSGSIQFTTNPVGVPGSATTVTLSAETP